MPGDELERDDEPAGAGERLDLVYGAVVGTLYVVAVAASVFVVVDEATHGELSRSLAARWAALTARWQEWRRIERTAREQGPYVVFEATEAAREAAADTGEGAP